MRYFFVLLLPCLLLAGVHNAYGRKHKHRGEPKTEVDLMNSVVDCLSHKDTVSYFYLFPPFDTLWRMVTHNSDHSPEAEKQLSNLREHPQALIDFDPFYNHQIMGRFCGVLTKGEDSGVHWNSIVIQRYELQKQNLTQNLAGYDRIAPERFKGFLFVRDLLGRHTFCITITEIQKISGNYYGGQVINILEASSIDQFLAKEDQENKYFEWLATHPITDTAKPDSAKTASADSLDDDGEKKKGSLSANDEENAKNRKEVVDRKYYQGKFDDEIPVELYVRYMKDLRTGKVSMYDGLYKFGDQKDFVKLDIALAATGKWTMEDDPPVGSLELVLINRAYTGTWTNNENGAGYDVVLKQADIPEKKIEALDNILDKGLSGSASEESMPERQKTAEQKREEKEKKMNEDRGNDNN